MSIEDRLFVVLRESVGAKFKSFRELAELVQNRRPPEFTYNRLNVPHVMQIDSIMPYVSLAHFLGLLRATADDRYASILDKEPTVEGAQVLIARKAVAKLEECGFTRDAFEKACKRMFRAPSYVLPSPHDIYRAMNPALSEMHFTQATSIGRVRAHFGFSIVQRRLMVPAETESA